jgi:ech hydrogenase subunit D
MSELQEMAVAELGELAAKCASMAAAGARLVQVSCTSLADSFEVTYSFDRDYKCSHIRVLVPRSNAVLPSITKSYFAAFTYENEMQDLFGIKVEGLALDFKGNFYRKVMPAPFAAAPVAPAPKKAA